MKKLKYIGRGSWIPGVPAKDLEEKDLKRLGLKAEDLIASGLYQPVEKPKRSEK